MNDDDQRRTHSFKSDAVTHTHINNKTNTITTMSVAAGADNQSIKRLLCVDAT